MYYKVRVNYSTLVDEKVKKVNELVLVEAVGLTDIDVQVTKGYEGTQNMMDFSIGATSPDKKIVKVIADESDTDFCEAIVEYTIENDKGKEKKVTEKYIIAASDIVTASNIATDDFKNSNIIPKALNVKISKIKQIFIPVNI